MIAGKRESGLCSIQLVGLECPVDMKILFVAPRYHTNQHFIMKALIDNGHAVKFVALYRGFSEEYSILDPIVVDFSHFSRAIDKLWNKKNDPIFRAKYGLPKITQLLGIMRAFDPDVVVVRSPRYLVSLLFILISKIFGKRFVMCTQGPKFRRNISRSIGIMRWLLLDVLNGLWITPVEGEKKCNSLPTHRSLYYLPFVYEATDHNLKRSYFQGGKVRILSVGKYLPRKNHILLLEAIRKLRNIGPIEVTLIGECTTDEHRRQLCKIHEFIVSKGLSDVVDVKVNLSFRDVQLEYLKHDLFVLPSSNEPAAYSILEAMAHGLAVICSDSNGTKEYIKYGHTGYVFRSDCISDLIDKLSILLNTRDHIVECGMNGFEVAKCEYSPEKYHTAFMTMIKMGFGLSEPLQRR